MKFSALVDQLVSKEIKKPMNWHSRLDAEARKELDEIKSRYRAGKYGEVSKRAIARAIVSAAKERGWRICGENGVREWLTKD